MVLFDYEKQQDDELSLKVGDVITDMEQVCEQYVHQEHHIWIKQCSCLKQYKLPKQVQLEKYSQIQNCVKLDPPIECSYN